MIHVMPSLDAVESKTTDTVLITFGSATPRTERHTIKTVITADFVLPEPTPDYRTVGNQGRNWLPRTLTVTDTSTDGVNKRQVEIVGTFLNADGTLSKLVAKARYDTDAGTGLSLAAVPAWIDQLIVEHPLIGQWALGVDPGPTP